MIAAETFKALCVALWGGAWDDRAAEALGRNVRTVQRWASGQNEIPEGDAMRLAVVAAERARDVMAAMARLVLESQGLD